MRTATHSAQAPAPAVGCAPERRSAKCVVVCPANGNFQIVVSASRVMASASGRRGLWSAATMEDAATPSGAPELCVATARGHKAPTVTPTGLLDAVSGGVFATPLEEEDDTPRSDAAGAWSPEGSPERELLEDDEFDLAPEALSYFQFGAPGGSGAFGASGLPAAALAAGTPAPGCGSFAHPAPAAPRKGPTAFPSRVQGGSASASRCRERLACAARPPRPRVWPRRTSFGVVPRPPPAALEEEGGASSSGRVSTPPPPSGGRSPPAPWDSSSRAAPTSPSFLERAQGITGTRKRLDDALDDAVPCAMTPKRLRGAEDMFASMRID